MKIPEIIRRYPSGKWIPGPETLTGLTVRTVLSICLSPGGGERELGGGVYAKRSPGRAEREWWEMARIGRRVVVCGSSLRPQEKRMKRACIVRVITPNHPENG